MAGSRFVCQSCGAVRLKWIGKCPECTGWNTYVEEIVRSSKNKRTIEASSSTSLGTTAAITLNDIEISVEARTSTSIAEFDRVLGGGLVNGAVMLLGGDPGIGKSTLALQIAHHLTSSTDTVPTLYVTGEESLHQLKLRADRITTNSKFGETLQALSETNLLDIEAVITKAPPRFVVIDSIQAIYWDELPSAPGSIGQIRECAARITRLAKKLNFAVLIIGHVTKDGNIAGPKILEHMVDTVLYFEGDQHRQFRIIRSFKNRFGSTNEIGIFEMKESGLEEVLNPSKIFLQDRVKEEAGSVVVATMEGTRPLLVEIQALVTPNSGFGAPRRTVSGVDNNRLAIILAILEKKAGYKLSQCDVYLNVVGGVEIAEPAADLAMALAVISSLTNKPIPQMTAVFGELGLSGEIRPVNQAEARLQEIKKLGFERVILPKAKYSKANLEALEQKTVEKIWDGIL